MIYNEGIMASSLSCAVTHGLQDGWEGCHSHLLNLYEVLYMVAITFGNMKLAQTPASVVLLR